LMSSSCHGITEQPAFNFFTTSKLRKALGRKPVSDTPGVGLVLSNYNFKVEGTRENSIRVVVRRIKDKSVAAYISGYGLNGQQLQEKAVKIIMANIQVHKVGNKHEPIEKWRGIFTNRAEDYFSLASGSNITPLEVNFPGFVSPAYRFTPPELQDWWFQALTHGAQVVCKDSNLEYIPYDEMYKYPEVLKGQMPKGMYPMQFAEYYFRHAFVSGDNEADVFKTMCKMIHPKGHNDIEVTKDEVFFCATKDMMRRGYASVKKAEVIPLTRHVLERLDTPKSSVGIWNASTMGWECNSASEVVNSGTKKEFRDFAIDQLEQVFADKDLDYLSMPQRLAFLNKISIKHEKRGPFDDISKVRFIYLSSLPQYYLDQATGKSLAIFIRYKGDIYIGEKWRGDGMTRLHNDVTRGTEGQDYIVLQGDISKMDINHLAWSVGWLTAWSIVMYAPQGLDYEKNFCLFIAHSADTSAVKIIYNPFIGKFMMVQGVLASGSFGTSSQQTLFLKWMFEYWLEFYGAQPAERDGNPELAKEIRKMDHTFGVAYGDDNQTKIDPKVHKYLNIESLRQCFAKWKQVLKPEESKEFIGKDAFLTSFTHGSVTPGTDGPRFLKKYCVKSNNKLKVDYLPMRPIEDYFSKVATTTTKTNDPFTYLLVLGGLADDNMGLNKQAHVFLKAVRDKVMENPHVQTNYDEVCETMALLDSNKDLDIPYNLQKVLSESRVRESQMTLLEQLQFPSRSDLLYRFVCTDNNITAEQRSKYANPHPEWAFQDIEVDFE